MLPTHHVEQYQRDGYALVPGLVDSDRLDRLEASFDAILARRQAAGDALDATWQGERWRDRAGAQDTVVLHTHDLQAHCAEWTRVLTDDLLTGAMSALLGTPNVQLHHTKLFAKPSERGSPFPLHQDHGHFPHERHTMMAAVLHLTDATEEMGCIRVVRGTHHLGPLPLGEHLHLDPDVWPVETATPIEARRGDVLFFSYLLVHGSGVNRSARTRKTVLFQVRDPSDRALTEQHRSHAQGMMLRGVDPLVPVQSSSGSSRCSGRGLSSEKASSASSSSSMSKSPSSSAAGAAPDGADGALPRADSSAMSMSSVPSSMADGSTRGGNGAVSASAIAAAASSRLRPIRQPAVTVTAKARPSK